MSESAIFSCNLSPLTPTFLVVDSARTAPLPALTSCRLFAALVVIVFHFGHESLLHDAPAALQRLLHHGHEAVLFFFILSGFVLGYRYYSVNEPESCRGSRRDFWSARAARLYPVYALSLLLTAPSVLYQLRAGTIGPDETVLATLLAPALLQGWWPNAAAIWNLPAWSLSAEVFFYALFPWLLPRLAPLPPRVAIGLLSTAVLLAAVLRVALDHLLPATGLPAIERARLTEYLPLLHVPVFCCGIWLGLQHRRARLALPHANRIALTAALLLLLLFTRELPAGLPLSPVTVPLCCALIAGLASATGWLQRALSARWWQLGGAASYALYLLHYPLFYLLLPVVKRLGWSDPRSSTAFFLLYLAVSLTTSLAVYHWWEAPCQRWLRTRLSAAAVATVPAAADVVPATTAPAPAAASGP